MSVMEAEADQVETVEEVTEPTTVVGPVEGEQVEGQTEETPSIEDRFKELEAKYDADSKKFDNAQQLINRQGQELGQLRQATSQQNAEPKDSAKYLEEFAENPQKVIEDEIARREMERTQSASQQELAALQLKGQVLNYVPEFEDHLPAIQEWYKDKGASESFVQNLSNTVYSNVDLAVALGDVAKMQSRIAELETQINDGRAGAEQTIDKMQAAAKRGRTVGAKSGGAVVGTRDMSDTDVTQLSDAELQSKLAELSR